MTLPGGMRIARPRPAHLTTALVAGIVVLWSVQFVGIFAGVVALPLPLVLPLLFLVPPALVFAWLMGAGDRIPGLAVLTGWMALVAGALVASLVVPLLPVIVAIPPALVVVVLCVRRWRVASLAIAFFVASTFGSLTAFTPLKPGPMVDVLLLGLIVALVWPRPGRERPANAFVWPSVVAVAAYVFVGVIGILLATTPEFGLLAFRSAAWYLLAFLVIGFMPWTDRELRAAGRAVVAVAALVAGYAVLRWIIGPAGKELEVALSAASIYNFVDGRLRTFGSFTSGHELGAYGAAIVPYCAAVAFASRGTWRLVGTAGAGLGLCAVLASEARIGLLAVAAGLAVVFVLQQAARGIVGLRLGMTVLAVIVGAGLSVFAYTEVVDGSDTRAERFSNILTPDRDPAYQARVVKWKTAMAGLEQAPLGHGLGTAGRVQQRAGRFVTDASVNVDNAYLKIAWEQGYAILALYVLALLGLLVALGRRAITVPDATRAGPAIGATGTLAAYMVLLFAALYDEGLTALVVWIIVGLGVANVVRRRPSRT